jgi:hypothetical protein
MREISYRLSENPSRLEYSATIWSNRPDGVRALQTSLLAQREVVRFSITPTKD